MTFGYDNVLIYGYSQSGKAVEQVLIANQIKHKIFDDNLRLNGGKYLKKINEKTLNEFNLMVISPGISIYNKNVVLAEKLGVKVVSELEFGFWFCPCPIIAVTGTNGKTTTVHLINELLQKAGFKSAVFGNVGTPLSKIAFVKELDYAVVEVSSFQLEACDKFCPKIGIILNIAQDHLDRHKTLNNYILCKVNLFKNSDQNTLAILNGDDEKLAKYSDKINAKKIYFSEKKEVQGAFVKSEDVVATYKNSNEDITNLKELNLTKTFLENLLATYLVAKELDISKDVFLDMQNNFKFLPNRLEVVDTIKETEFINDSKGTNIHATQNALKHIKKDMVLLLGGLNKGLDFAQFFKCLPKTVKAIVLFGNARKSIYKAAKKLKIPVYSAMEMEHAVYVAYRVAKPGSVVLLSPACASYDSYISYAKRGEHFVKIVKALKEYEVNKTFAKIKNYNLKAFFKKGKKFVLLKKDKNEATVDLSFLVTKKFKKLLRPKNKFHCCKEKTNAGF